MLSAKTRGGRLSVCPRVVKVGVCVYCVADAAALGMSHAFVLSADGSWRWSPPGRIRVRWDGSSHASLLAAAKHATRLSGDAWRLSLDGLRQLDPTIELQSGCKVHLISDSALMVRVRSLPAEAMYHLKVEAELGEAAAAAWVEALSQRWECASTAALVGEAFAGAPALLERGRELLRGAPVPDIVEVERGSTVASVVSRAWAAAGEPARLLPPSVVERLVLTVALDPDRSQRVMLRDLTGIGPDAALALELPLRACVSVRVSRPVASSAEAGMAQCAALCTDEGLLGVLMQVHPGMGLDAEATAAIKGLIDGFGQLVVAGVDTAGTVLRSGGGGVSGGGGGGGGGGDGGGGGGGDAARFTFGGSGGGSLGEEVAAIEEAIKELLPIELVGHALREGHRVCNLGETELRGTARPGLVFESAPVAAAMGGGAPSSHVRFLTAVLEYLSAELLELSGNQAKADEHNAKYKTGAGRLPDESGGIRLLHVREAIRADDCGLKLLEETINERLLRETRTRAAAATPAQQAQPVQQSQLAQSAQQAQRQECRVAVDHRYAWPVPVPCATVGTVRRALADALQLPSSVHARTQLLTSDGMPLAEHATLEESGVRCGAPLELMLPPGAEMPALPTDAKMEANVVAIEPN